MLEARPAWQYLAQHVACHGYASAHFGRAAFIEQFFRFRVPVGDKCRVELTDDGSGDAHDQLDIVNTFPDITGFVIGVLDQVLRAGKADGTIHDNDFAVITQVDAIPLVIKGLRRERFVHRDASRAQLLQNRTPQQKVTEMIDQHPADDAAFPSAHQRIEHTRANLVVGEHEILEVHIAFCSIDIPDDPIHGTDVIGQQLNCIASHRRHPGQLGDKIDVRLETSWQRWIDNRTEFRYLPGILRKLFDALVHVLLLFAPPLGKLGTAQQEEQDRTQDRRQKDQ